MISYEQWCTKNTNIIPLARSLKSSVPEQYIGFYLQNFFGDIIECQKQFDWLGKNSLDIFISSLQLGIEYDGIYFHANREEADKLKTSLCKKTVLLFFGFVKLNTLRVSSQSATWFIIHQARIILT